MLLAAERLGSSQALSAAPRPPSSSAAGDTALSSCDVPTDGRIRTDQRLAATGERQGPGRRGRSTARAASLSRVPIAIPTATLISPVATFDAAGKQNAHDRDQPSDGGEPSVPFNAFYCRPGDFLAWDLIRIHPGRRRREHAGAVHADALVELDGGERDGERKQGAWNVSETARSSGADGSDSDQPRSTSRHVWSCCVYVATAAGLLGVIARWGLRGAVTSVVLVAVSVAVVATTAWAGDGRLAVRRIAHLTLATGLIAPAIVGLVAVLEFAGVLIVLILAGTTPALISLVRARRLPPGDLPEVQPELGTPRLPASSDQLAPSGRSGEPALELSSLDDDALCLAWRRSFLQLEAARSAVDRLSIVELRQKYLDELHRRSPEGLAAWFASGARASGNPLPYVGDPRRRAG